jgi:hypothetical protein
MLRIDGQRDEPLLCGVAMGDYLEVGRKHERIALLADPDQIHESPQVFERDAGDQPACGRGAGLQADRKIRGRQAIVVQEDCRDFDPLSGVRGHRGNLGFRRTDPARRHHAAAGVEQRDLVELGKLEDVILEDAGLLPLRERRLGELLCRRTHDPRGVVDIQLHAGRDLIGQRHVALVHRLAGAAAQAGDRQTTVDHQRRDRRGRDQHHEA